MAWASLVFSCFVPQLEQMIAPSIMAKVTFLIRIFFPSLFIGSKKQVRCQPLELLLKTNYLTTDVLALDNMCLESLAELEMDV